MASSTAEVREGMLYLSGPVSEVIPLSSARWAAWLEEPDASAFRFRGAAGSFTARREQRGDQRYWYAYRKERGHLHKAYLGRADELTHARLAGVAARLTDAVASPAVVTGPTRHTVPAQPGALIGRERELPFLRRQVRNGPERLVTLVGPPGVGKTRLALAVAESLQTDLPGGAALVDLAPLAEPRLVMPTLAASLGLAPGPGLSERLRECVAEPLLVVLDNCEHVLEAAPDIADLLGVCAPLRLLATSREPLALRWEQVVPVEPLAVPDLERPLPPLPRLARIPAVDLFVQRARAATPGFALTAANAPAIATICARLDGLPLAVELVAARSRTTLPDALLAQVEQRLNGLVAVKRDRPERQRTLEEEIRWSEQLLEEAERVVLRRLGVFRGGCTLAMAQGVCGDEDLPAEQVARSLEALVSKSLVQTQLVETGDGQVARYRLLQTVRAFAEQRLAEAGEQDEVRERHARTVLDLVESTDVDSPAGLLSIEREQGNARAALSRALESGADDVALRLAAVLGSFWDARGDLTKGRRWLGEVLGRAEGLLVPARAAALVADGDLALRTVQEEVARERYEEALALSRALGDMTGALTAMERLASLCRWFGRLEEAAERAEELLALSRGEQDAAAERQAATLLAAVCADRGDYARCRELAERLCLLGEQSRDYSAIWAGQNLMGVSAGGMGQLQEAHQWAEHALRTARSWGRVPNLITALTFLSCVALERGDPAGAGEPLVEMLALVRRHTHGVRAAVAVWDVAQLACEAGRHEQAVRLFGAVEAVQPRFYRIGDFAIQVLRWDVAGFRPRVERVRSILGEAAFDRAWAAGRALSPEQALDLAEQTLLEIRGDVAGPLSAREREVARLVARGHSNRQIADHLVLSARTVERHVENCLAKLNLTSRTQLATWAVEHGLADAGRSDQGRRR